MPAICVKELRKALDDEAKTPRFIETVHGRGYRFVARVTSDAPTQPKREPRAAWKSPKPIVVGREVELAQLQNWYSDVLGGQRRVVFVGGEAGIGKTVFVQAFMDSIVEDGAVRLGRGQCVEQYGAGEPYMPVLEALTRLSQEAGCERVVELLGRFAPTWLAQMPAVLAPEERARLRGQNQDVTQQRMLREMAQALEALAAEAPLVLLLEDLHWSDFSTLELISAVARRTESARLLILATYRPVEMLAHDHPLRTMKQELELHHYCEELRLKLLNEEDVASYLARRFSSDGAPTFAGLAPVIYERTDGNPLFMVNVVDYLVNTGLLASSREASASESADILLPNVIEVPRSVRQMIERNFERLQPEEQMVLEGACAVGAEFSAAAVAAALERPQDEVEQCFARLSRREQFVNAQGAVAWPDGTLAGGFRFHHALYQEVLYERLPAGRKVQVHRRIAMREEAGYGERAGEVASELAHHYSCANDKSKVIKYLGLAGERAVARGAVVEAEDHYNQALKVLGDLSQTMERDHLEMALQMALGNVLWSSKSWSHPEAGRAFARALELAEKLDEAAQMVRVLHGLVGASLGNGNFKQATDLGERMLRAAESSGDRRALCAAHTRYGETLIWRARFVEAQKHLGLGSEYYNEISPTELDLRGIDAPAALATVVLLLGFPDRARQMMNRALRRLECCDHRFWVGLVHMWAASFYTLARDASGALEHAQALLRLARKEPVWTGVADANIGRALIFQGKWEEGGIYLRRAIAFYKSVGLVSQLMPARVNEAELLAHEGQIDDGLVLLDEALADSEELLQIRSPALRQRAALLAQSGAKASTVEAAYRAAIECALGQGAKYYELQATTSFARWLNSQGRAAEAQTLLAEIYGWFTEGFDTPALSEAKAVLDELSGKPSAPRRS
jgi:tetratricopeptide (TPR) repeat protein